MNLDMHRIIRGLQLLALVLVFVAVGALATDDLHQRSQVSSLVSAQRRSRPVTEFNTAYFIHNDCLKAYELQFFADIADAVISTDRDGAASELAADRDELRATFERLCPSPEPPTFDKDGNLTKPPVVHDQQFPPTQR